MKFEIKNRYTGKVIIEGEAENIKEFLEENRGANLREANLRGADLQEANLWGAKIKITQQVDLIRSLGIIIEN